jgi:hypothetical protein
MGDIYSSASRVLIWLGKGNPLEDVAINLLSAFKGTMHTGRHSEDSFAKLMYQRTLGISSPGKTRYSRDKC